MISKYRRYETLLPLRRNDGAPIPRQLFNETVKELIDRFGAVSPETQVIKGQWRQHEQTHSDQMVRVFVDVPDTPENWEFFLKLKEALKSRFEQTEIWITSYRIDVL